MESLVFPSPGPLSVKRWIDQTIEFIARNFEGSGLHRELVDKLQSLNSSSKVSVRELGLDRQGGYNRLTRTLTVNGSKFHFFKRDFLRQLQNLNQAGDTRRAGLVLLQFQAAILELSGVLIHEAQHACHWCWSRRLDETEAFQVEQRWYLHLYHQSNDHQQTIRSLAQNVESDCRTAPCYKGLGLLAPSLLPDLADSGCCG